MKKWILLIVCMLCVLPAFSQSAGGNAIPATRPQNPKPPYPYHSEEVRFENKEAGITLAGTFTWPKEGKNFPAVVLISGSGPQNRNEDVLGHSPFLVLSDHLTRNGIAVFRYDDRGVTESGGEYQTAGLDDFAADAASAVAYLKTRKEINPKKTGVLGHSEGGTIAFMLAGEKKNNIAFVVSLAGMAIPGDSLLRMQRYLISTKAGASETMIAQNEALIETISKLINQYPSDYILQNINQLADEVLPDSLKSNVMIRMAFPQGVKQLMSPELQSLMKCNPAGTLAKIQCPVLALGGDKDLQVPAGINLDRVKALVKSPVTIKGYPGLNHLFQHCATGLVSEYGSIEETIAPEVLEDIAAWIKQVSFLPSDIRSQSKSIPFENTIQINTDDSNERIIEKAAHVIPTANQLEALKNEFIAFIHFGPNTYTRMEWGNGMEDTQVFDLKEADTDQWCEAMKAAGMKMVILTAKHHDGFVLWQSRYTHHGIMATSFQEGKGDIMKNLSESCHKYGLKLGIYLSPADLYQIESPEGLYGNLSPYTKRTIPREVPGRPFSNKTRFEFMVDDYNEYFLNQLFELLTEYGPVHEVWFDGAHPKTKGGQKYNYLAWKELIKTLAPQAAIFGKEDIRWCGNEAGNTRDSEWNVITYEDNPDTMNDFMDLHGDLGTQAVYFNQKKPYYLHYQPAETDVSIRDGWFYRDDTHQKVRNADDVFDIYERSAGGNSIFLLNIPPNREGKFSPVDVSVLKETGKRIRETYSVDLLKKAKGPEKVLDHDANTFIILDKQPQELIISMTKPVTMNRIVIQEAIAVSGERVEKHAVDAWIDGRWKEIAQATNIGYKRILRFPEVTTNKIRVRILASRLAPAISSVSAHYYHSRPPMLEAKRDIQGIVTIESKRQDFNGNSYENNSLKNINGDFEIYYTIDGSEPTIHSTKYQAPFLFENGELKAVSVLNGEMGNLYSERFGLIKKTWKLLETPPFITLDLGEIQTLKGFAYTPPKKQGEGMMEEGMFQVSDDGKTWEEVEAFRFGNLINDPTRRYHYFEKPVASRYIRIQATNSSSTGDLVSIAELDLF